MDGLKQRVVGALVIVSLAVIFLPMIFDEPHQTSKTQLIPIPVQPELPVITIDNPQKPNFKIIEPSTTGDQVAEVEDSTEIALTEKVHKLSSDQNDAEDIAGQSAGITVVEDNATKETGKANEELSRAKSVEEKSTITVFKEQEFKNVWMVQLGTFGNHKNAYNLRDMLRKEGFDGHTTKINKNGKELVRVFSGPYADKAYADKTKKRLDKQFKLKTLVVHFD